MAPSLFMRLKPKAQLLTVTLLAATCLMSITWILYFVTFQQRVSGFFRIGDVLTQSPYLAAEQLFIFQGEVGYDGQMFLTIALDPTLQHPQSVQGLDNPTYRYKRMLYPVLGYIAALGQRSLIPYALVLINLLAVLLMIFLLSRFCLRSAASPLEALWLLAVPGVWYSYTLATSDILGAAWCLLALYAYTERRPAASTLALAAACLTKESMFVLVPAFAAASYVDGRHREGYATLLAAIPLAAWLLWVHITFPEFRGTHGLSENFSWPGLGIWNKFASFATAPINAKFFYMLLCFFSVIVAFWFLLHHAMTLWKSDNVYVFSTLGFFAIFVLSKMETLIYYINYYWIFLPVFILTLLVSFTQKQRRFRFAFFSLCFVLSAPYIASRMSGP